MKLLGYLTLLLASVTSQEELECEEDYQCNNQTIIIDEWLNFTWSTDKMFTEDLLNLVPTPGKDEEDKMIPIFNGHFELNDWPEDVELTPDSSFRFCMQYWKKYDGNGNEITDAFGSQSSKRSRMRYFNKRFSDFAFFPQLALAKDGLNSKGVNPDYFTTTRSSGVSTESDEIRSWCYRPFGPQSVEEGSEESSKESSGESSEESSEESSSSSETLNQQNYLVEGGDVGDTMGIAVLRQVINLEDRKAEVSFYRPLESLSEYDATLEVGQEYMVYINWGIFDDHQDSTKSKVRGMMLGSEAQEMKILTALSAQTLIISIISFISVATSVY